MWKMKFMPCHRAHILKLTSTSLTSFTMSVIYFYQMVVMTFLEACYSKNQKLTTKYAI